MRTDAPGDLDDRTIIERRDPLVGTILDGRFRIDFQIAAGGFGAIYRATDLRDKVEVALKVLHTKLARDPNVIERFRREGATLSNLRDPHTITAHELGEAADGTLYIVMELLHGESLYHQFRARGPLPWPRVVHIARGVCSSLGEAHGYGIVHRDLKPANIHLEARGDDTDFVKVLDFGIAKIVHGGEYDRNELTQAGQMIGTVDYMSPEQMVGGEMTGRSDIYTLGVVMYEMLTGRTPYPDAQNATAILAAVLTRTPDPLSHYIVIPPALDRIVARCLEREATKRFPDVAELDAALAALEPDSGTRPTVALTAATFEPSAPTNETTRVDVRATASSQPVLDVRGPRVRPAEVVFPPAIRPTPPPVGDPVHAARARGSQNAMHAPAMGTPRAFPPPAIESRGNTQHMRSYDMAAAASHDALVRRIIWVLLFLVSMVITLIVTR
jgi:serine/threonine-protein kinase